MASPSWAPLGVALAASALAALGWGSATWLVARRVRRHNIIDTAWGLGFCVITLVTAVVSVAMSHRVGVHAALFVVLVGAWGLRLSWHVGRRGVGKGEDPRYADLLAKHGGNRTATAWTYIYLPQLLALYVVSLPVQVGALTQSAVGPLGWVGVTVWAVGITFESVGDAQMTHFKLEMPSPVVADALGYHPVTAAKIATQAGVTWSRYAPGNHTRTGDS